MEIGGDWYDAVELDDGRVAIAVGDVVGRGLPAAATMGHPRGAGVTALQAADPSDAVAILDRYAAHVPGAVCATVAFAMLDPEAESMTYITAGHPPPLLVTPDGEVSYLAGSVSWPLGTESANRRAPAAASPLPPGSLLLLYTDGLVERRGESLEVGLAHLRSVVSRCWSLPLRRLEQTIFAEMVDEHASDDIALVSVRTVGSTPSVFADVFLASPRELSRSRKRLRTWLDEHGIVGHEHDDIVLGLGEAIANAIDHGSTDERQVVRVEIAFDGDALVGSVSDSGQWQPGIEGFFTGRGRGHVLMRALAESVELDTDQHGTIVTLRFLPEGELV